MTTRALVLLGVVLGALAPAAAQTRPGAQQTKPAQAKPGAQAKPAPRERTPAQQARDEWNRGSIAYRAGRYAEARAHFERARELDPKLENVRLYIARSIARQYRQGDPSPENVAKGEEAVAAYEALLADEPANDDAFRSLYQLHVLMGNEERARDLLLRRANDATAPPAKRAEIFFGLAAREHKCAFEVTERKENKESVGEAGKQTVRYKMPADVSQFYRAQQCAMSGLEFAEQATQLAPESAAAWSHKANLARELAKLAEMEGNVGQKEFYEQQHAAAQERYRALGGRPEAPAALTPPNVVAPPPDPPIGGAASETAGGAAGRVVSGGVLNGKLISKPEPEYPDAARAARAEGVVVVQVVVDEEGKVINASAVSGHPLLQQAAVNAAMQARLSPTLLSGQPVKVSGTITYNFALR